ncbi:MAG TPA: GntR family transcriptional regulator [Patescibacteria group bacterium]|nr:GntR family transcriptional regulator [Patescibacteria group bacterium]
MSWDLKSDRPIYSQLIEQMQIKICSGIFAPGSKLPSVRELAQEAAVNPNTMQKALSLLEEDGLLYTNRTSGRFITEDANMIQQAKHNLAQEQISEFLEKMKSLGLSKTETLSIISTMLEEAKK